MTDKQWLGALKPLVNNTHQWSAFNEMVDHLITLQHNVLEQSADVVVVARAQGQILALKKLKQLRDEVNAAK